MSNTRMFLLLGLFAMGFLIYNQWQIDYGPQPVANPAENAATDQPEAPVSAADLPDAASLPTESDVPPAMQSAAPAAPAAPAAESAAGRVRITTDVLDLELSLAGGTLVQADLLDFAVAPDIPDSKVRLMSDRPGAFYVAQTGLLADNSPAPNHTQLFSAASDRFMLADGADELVVPLTWYENGVTVRREYVLTRGLYTIQVRDFIENNTSERWIGRAYRQLQREPLPEFEGSTFTNPQRFSFTGPAIFTPEDKYQKFDFEDLSPQPEQATSSNGWMAMVQHYFLSAWVPPADEETTFQVAQITGQLRFVARAFSPVIAVEPGSTGGFEATLVLGPKLQDRLDDIAEGLALTVDYGVFTPFSKILFWLLEKIYGVVGNWGWAIVLLTVLVKAAFYKLTEAQYKSMAKLRKLQPRIQSLKERYGDDKQQFNLKMMEIYKTEKVNPLGGCLPVLIQIPVFIALYWVLVESVELRQAPFMLWINDLSSPDPYFILPIINGAAMFMTTKLSPNPAADPIQQRIMLSMPIIFSVMFAFFQAGLVLYWAVNAVLSLAQQWVITKRIDAQG
ncbi:MAG: membrane protein insertase YidC [Pseudomonadota bacterium]